MPHPSPLAHHVLRLLAMAWGVCIFASQSFATPPTLAPPRALVALMVPLSGPYAKMGKQLAQTAQIAAKEAQIHLLLLDTHLHTPAALKARQTALAHPHLAAIVGPVGVQVSRAMIPQAHARQVPMLLIGATKGMERQSPWVWRLRPTAGEYAEAIALEARRQGAGRAAILYPETPFGIEAAIHFGQTFLAKGGTLTAISSYTADTKDWRHPLDVLRGRRARISDTRTTRTTPLAPRVVDFDVLFVPDFHSRIATFLPLMQSVGILPGPGGGGGQTVQLLGVPGWQGASLRHTGSLAAGALYHDPFAGGGAEGEAEEFERLIEEQTGRLPVDLDAEVFDAVVFTGRVAKQAFSAGLRGQGLRERVANTLPAPTRPWYGMCGLWSFDPYGAPLRPFRLYRFDADGVVTPQD